MYDAIVVGARCAGSPLAMLLARQGHSVLVVDRATFPSDTLSTHYIQSGGSQLLRDWGLLDQVVALGAPPVKRQIMTMAGIAMPADPQDPYPICPRRTSLDKLLVDAAAAAGAEIREGFTVDEVLIEDGRVVGIRGRDRGLGEVTERATIVVGADGYQSGVAKAVGAAAYNVVPSSTCGYYGYFSGFGGDGAELHVGGGQAVFAFPTNDGLTCIAMERPAHTLDETRSDPAGTLQRAFDKVPGFGERLRAARLVGKLSGLAARDSFYRKAWGPGWALAGDAGFHKDPVLGAGMTDAFRDAAALASAIDDGLCGRVPMDDALARFEANRDATTGMMYQITNLLAKDLDPTPEVAQMMAMGMAAGAAQA